MREVLIPHVPSQDPFAVNVVASMTSFCMTGVFWIAANMLRVVGWIIPEGKKVTFGPPLHLRVNESL